MEALTIVLRVKEEQQTLFCCGLEPQFFWGASLCFGRTKTLLCEANIPPVYAKQ